MLQVSFRVLKGRVYQILTFWYIAPSSIARIPVLVMFFFLLLFYKIYPLILRVEGIYQYNWIYNGRSGCCVFKDKYLANTLKQCHTTFKPGIIVICCTSQGKKGVVVIIFMADVWSQFCTIPVLWLYFILIFDTFVNHSNNFNNFFYVSGHLSKQLGWEGCISRLLVKEWMNRNWNIYFIYKTTWK